MAERAKPTRQTKTTKPIEVREGNTKLRIYRGTVKKGGKGYPQFTLCYYEGGSRHRKTFADLDEAKTEAGKVASRLEQGHRDVLKLTNADQHTYAVACRELKATGIPLLDAIRQYVAAVKALPTGSSVIEAAKEYSKRHTSNAKRRTVAEVVAEFYAAKEKDGVSAGYMRTLRYHLNPFAEQFKNQISAVMSGDMDTWLRGLGHSQRTRKNAAVSLVTLFKFARGCGYLPKNTPTEAESITKQKTVRGGKIGILTPDQLQKILTAADTDEKRIYFALGAFTGIRAAELARLDWQDVGLARRFVTIEADKAKTATRRLVPICDALAEWLRPYAKRKGLIFPSKRAAERLIEWAGKIIGGWPKNALRHSFISYRVAETQNVNQTALEAGNSPKIIFSNYRELVEPADAAKWFAIKPPGQPGNVVSMEAVA